MLIGIDVGGTFTDAVVLEEGRIIGFHKARTTHDNLLHGLLAALDGIRPFVKAEQVERVTLSTTAVTNRIIQHQEDKVDLYIIPGPGMNVKAQLPVEPVVLPGYTDHRGELCEAVPLDAWEQILGPTETRLAAVSGKFSVRCSKEESKMAQWLQEAGYTFVSEGAKLSGALNFPRRTVSAYYNSAVKPCFDSFKGAVEKALKERQIVAPLYILKADGGSLPMQVIAERPVETVFTGPAASVLGMSALLSMPERLTVALDIGGTTTDISLWREGKPIMARGGVSIGGYPSAVRSFQVTSVGIGGETAIRVIDGQLQVGPDRVGPSLALGGSLPTLGDALVVLNKASYGDREKSWQGLEQVALALRLATPEEAAQLVVDEAIRIIDKAIWDVVEKENKRPIYTVGDIVNPHYFTVEQLVVVGGTAESLAPLIEDQLQKPVQIPEFAAVANAVGAALALATIEVTAYVASNKRTLVIPELGMQGKTSATTLAEVESLALKYGSEAAKQWGILDESGEEHFEVVSSEEFPVLEGWQSMGRRMMVTVQLAAGVRYHVHTK